ncbi:hypothetical protein PAF17_06810 [Paracoccus sp. Z330]|uniref:Lipopolysaccharide export system protein LptC n=1 Tax=Paracoccus onchidii TaxID=3017813 RepID=A0ABT4ZCX9_9RHOB|nr:hypothetical protein [Paracoccus onchidii]MDB6177217.1 hypothetical protein [Paracoccus onchidii]
MNRTRIVRWLRVLLPLVALAILSTMFLFSRRPDGDSRIPYAEVDAQQMAREPRIVAPEFAGVTGDGAEVTLRAMDATPASDERDAALQQVVLDWVRPDGLAAHLTAPNAGVGEALIALSGGVQMSLSSGWTLSAPEVEAATDRSHLGASNGVVATGPFGKITSEDMELHTKPTEGGAATAENPAVLSFSGGVRLLYQP